MVAQASLGEARQGQQCDDRPAGCRWVGGALGQGARCNRRAGRERHAQRAKAATHPRRKSGLVPSPFQDLEPGADPDHGVGDAPLEPGGIRRGSLHQQRWRRPKHVGPQRPAPVRCGPAATRRPRRRPPAAPPAPGPVRATHRRAPGLRPSPRPGRRRGRRKPRSWTVTTTPPPATANWRNSAETSSWWPRSSPVSGSSASSHRGSPARARAISTRPRSPPERLATSRRAKPSRVGGLERAGDGGGVLRTLARTVPRAACGRGPTRVSTSSRQAISGVWGRKPSWRARALGFSAESASPPRRTSPSSGRRRPARQLSKVDLPAPFGPTIAVTSPDRSVRLTPSTTARPPRRTRRSAIARSCPAGVRGSPFTPASGAWRSAAPGRRGRRAPPWPRPAAPRPRRRAPAAPRCRRRSAGRPPARALGISRALGRAPTRGRSRWGVIRPTKPIIAADPPRSPRRPGPRPRRGRPAPAVTRRPGTARPSPPASARPTPDRWSAPRPSRRR